MTNQTIPNLFPSQLNPQEMMQQVLKKKKSGLGKKKIFMLPLSEIKWFLL